MKYSSSYSYNQGYYGRLNNYRGWNPRLEDYLATLKIDFGLEKKKITAVVAQSWYGQFVSSYELLYSVDGSSWRHWIENAHEKVRQPRHSQYPPPPTPT